MMIMMMAAPQERGHHDCRQGAENEIQEAGGGSRNRQTKSQRQGAVIFTMRADAEKSIVFHLQFTLTWYYFENDKMSDVKLMKRFSFFWKHERSILFFSMDQSDHISLLLAAHLILMLSSNRTRSIWSYGLQYILTRQSILGSDGMMQSIIAIWAAN